MLGEDRSLLSAHGGRVMRRFYFISVPLLLLTAIILGCGKHEAKQENQTKDPGRPNVKVEPKTKTGDNDKVIPLEVKLDDEKQEKYQAAIGDAIRMLAD